jgi:FtsP/CotA-like multicopper oxidase with cupredoxin domain
MRRALVRTVIGLVVLSAATAVAWIGLLWWESRLPGTYNVMDHGRADYGGGSEHAHHGSGQGMSVARLHGPRGAKPDAAFTLTARQATIELASGRAVEALTFNGRSPGPELRVRHGDVVQVTLVNEDVPQGVTIHWHGVDVPNAEDGVAGVTQDAVLPGERHVYRFRAEQHGTFWYHTHQVSSTEVRRGLFGALVIEPARGSRHAFDRTVIAHTFDGIPTLDANDGIRRIDVAPGTEARLRLVNSDSSPRRFLLTGAPFRVLALDGTDLNDPGELRDIAVDVPGGGRADLGFTVLSSPVWLTLAESGAALALNTSRQAPAAGTETELPAFDPLRYGRPAQAPFGAHSAFDRRFELVVSRKLGFFDGRPGRQWALNGGIFPDVPMFHVGRGDLVEVTIVNDSGAEHPMHLHGHHVLVLGRDGEPASGSPWWPDTLNVEAGEEYRVAFRADNPGIWMDHCHNLPHAAAGLTMHVAYAGVTTPFLIGGEHDNEPE